MREIRLVHQKPQHNVRILQNAQDPRVGETDKSIYRLTSSDDSFTWNPILTEQMIYFLRFLKDNHKSLVVRLRGFSQDDENMKRWFHQACQWGLIVGLVSNCLQSQAFYMCHAVAYQTASVSMFLKMHLYPADFDSADAHNSIGQSFERSNCLNRLEIQALTAGSHEAFENLARTLSHGVASNRSIRNLVLSGWDHTALNHLFARLVDRDAPFDQLVLENAGIATGHGDRNSREWCHTLNRAQHIGFPSFNDSVTTSRCLYHLDSTVLSHVQLTKAGWTSRQIDGFLAQFSQSCPNLSTLDVYRNRVDDLTFPRFSALLNSNGSQSASHRRPLGSLTRFLLDANPILSDEKLQPSLYSLFQKIPSLVTILDMEAKNKTRKKEQAKLDIRVRYMRYLAIETPLLGMQLPPAAWPQLFSAANWMLRGAPSLQAQAIYEVLVNACAVLSNQATEDPVDPTATSSRSANEPLWVSVQKLLSWI